MNASSSGTSRQLSGTTTAPSLATAKNVSSNSTEFIISSADAVARADAGVGQHVGRAVDPVVELGEREAAVGVDVDERLEVGVEQGPLGDEVPDVR